VNFSAPFEQLAKGESFVSRGRTVTEADVDVLWRRDGVALEDPNTPTADGFVPIPL
jgi:hypothetical protein